MKSATASLTGGRRLARNVTWNLAAQLLPLAVALVCIPLIIQSAGVERFGILTLARALIGYSSIFDLGLGRALTKVVAEQLGSGEKAVPSTIWTGLTIIGAVGLAGGVLLYALAPWLAESALQIPADLQAELVAGFRLIALAVPIVTLGTALRGVIEAYQRFGVVATVNVLMGVVTFAGPLVALSYATSVSAMVLALIASRLLGAMAYGIYTAHVVRNLFAPGRIWGSARRLLRFGSWMTVTNVVGPAMDYMDRFIVGGLLSVSAVAYYATPFDVVTRLRTVSGALVGVLFPAFSTALVSDRPRAFSLYITGIRHLLLALTLPVFVLVVFADEGLRLWLGDEFARQSELVVQWLAVGQLINAVATMPYALLQAAGRPDVTARIHLFELPVYLLLVWWLVSSWGIVGAAAAWTLRVVADTALLLYLTRRLLESSKTSLRPVLTAGGAILVLIGAAVLPDSLGWKVFYLTMFLVVFPFIAMRWLVEDGEVARLLSHFSGRQPKGGTKPPGL